MSRVIEVVVKMKVADRDDGSSRWLVLSKFNHMERAQELVQMLNQDTAEPKDIQIDVHYKEGEVRRY